MAITPEQAIANYTFWLTFFTAILGIATVWLAIYTTHLALGAKDTATRQLRAYICDVSGMAVLESGMIKVVIDLKNSGQTPAYDVEVYCDPPVITQQNARPFDQACKFAPVKTIIGAGSEFQLTRFVTQITADDLYSIKNGICALFVWGRVNYTDAFKKRRHFVFRCIATGPTRDGWKLIPHQDGYEADSVL